MVASSERTKDLARAGLTGLTLMAVVVALATDRGSPAEVGLDLAVGLIFLGGGLTVWRGRVPGHTGSLMVGTALGWFLGGVLHRGPLAHFLVTYPSGALSRRLAPLVAAAYVDGIVESALQLDAATVAVSVLLAFAAVGQTVRAGGGVRRGRLVPSVATLAVALVLGGGMALQLAGLTVGRPHLAAYEVVLIAVCIGLTANLLSRGSQQIVTGLVVQLGDRTGGTLRDRLARALADPSLVLGYAVGDPPTYVDEHGDPIDVVDTDGRRMTRIDDRGERLALLVHDPSVLEDPRLVDAVSAATRIAVENVRLREEIAAQTAALEASQRRLLEAADLERRRIERQLEDRAIARLRHVREALRTWAGRDRERVAQVAVANQQVDAAESDLHALAMGIYPAALTAGGLRVAIGDLAAAADVRVQTTIISQRLSPLLEATTYYVCAESLANVAKHAKASRVEINVDLIGRRLRIAVTDDGDGGADPSGSGLEGLRSRVEALGGGLRVVSPPGRGTRIVAELPID
jgi:signal transduction histidine kinase